MLEKNRTNDNVIFILFLLALVWGNVFYHFIGFNFIDEIIVLCLVLFFSLNKIKSGGLKRIEKEFTIFILISIFYLFYSLLLRVNVVPAILSDFQQQLKPFITFYCIYYLSPEFSKSQKRVLRNICIILSVMIFCIILMGGVESFFLHPTNLASAVFNLSLTYLFFSKRYKSDILISLIILSLGLFSFRSKFYGEYICVIVVIFFIKSYIKLSLKTVLFSLSLFTLVLIFTWTKFNFYFVEGLQSEELARPILYINSLKNLNNFFPFGPGLGTYANDASRNYYSPLYDEYGISSVWGLSRDFDNFIADTYYPTLTQFGCVGLILFVLFWKNIYKHIKKKFLTTENLLDYKIGILIIIYILIESVADTALIGNRGVSIMMLLALVINNKQINKASL